MRGLLNRAAHAFWEYVGDRIEDHRPAVMKLTVDPDGGWQQSVKIGERLQQIHEEYRRQTGRSIS